MYNVKMKNTEKLIEIAVMLEELPGEFYDDSDARLTAWAHARMRNIVPYKTTDDEDTYDEDEPATAPWARYFIDDDEVTFYSGRYYTASEMDATGLLTPEEQMRGATIGAMYDRLNRMFWAGEAKHQSYVIDALRELAEEYGHKPLVIREVALSGTSGSIIDSPSTWRK